jgi:hypothetical protein
MTEFEFLRSRTAGTELFPGDGAANLSGDRRVPGARVAAVTNTGGIESGAALLARW